VNNTVFAEEPG